MARSFLTAVIRTFGSRWALAVVASAAAALAVVHATMPTPQMVRSVEGVPVASLVQDEHALVGDYLGEQIRADRAAGAAADRAWVRERSLAEAQAVAEAENRVAALKPALAKPAVKPAQVARIIEPAPRDDTAGEPLPLQVALAPPSAPRRPAVERVKSAIASVERIPRWMTAGVQQAAGWVTDLPIGTILPERHFL